MPRREIPFRHQARRFGKSKYGISHTVRVVLDLITVHFLLCYSARPIQILDGLGLLSFPLGIGFGGYLSLVKPALRQEIRNRPLLLWAILLTLLGIQLLSTGLLGESVVRTYYEAQGKSVYAARAVLDHERDEMGDDDRV